MFKLMVVPDYMPDQFSVWYLLNTWLQKEADLNIHLSMPESFEQVAKFQQEAPASMVYVNPFDAGDYVREQGYLPMVRPHDKSDEVVLLCHVDAAYTRVEDISAPLKLALSHNQDANFIGQRLLEPAGLSAEEMVCEVKDNFLMVASAVARRQADLGIVSADVYEQFNDITLNRIKVLLKSRINEVSHVWLVHPDYVAQAQKLTPLLTGLTEHETGRGILKGLGLPKGFEVLDEETMEFMIDVVDTLRN